MAVLRGINFCDIDIFNMSDGEIKTIKKLGNSELLQQTHSLVKEERRIGVQILHRLKEISYRRLYSELGYSSLFTCLVQEFKYPEATAYRLLNAMKLVSEVPEVEGKIQSGQLSVSTIAQVQSYCQAQKRENGLDIKLEEKKQILQAAEGRSKRETEKLLTSLHPEQPLPLMKETERVLTPHDTEIKFVANDQLLAKLNRIKDLTAHKNINPSYSELFDMMADTVLNKIDPIIKVEKLKLKQQKAEEALHQSEVLAEVPEVIEELPPGEVSDPMNNETDSPVNSQIKKKSRYIPAQIRREVWVKAGGQCCYVHPANGHRCTEKRGLEIEHLQAFAKNGTHKLSNLLLYCRNHNLHSARKIFGSIMNKYVPPQ